MNSSADGYKKNKKMLDRNGIRHGLIIDKSERYDEESD